MRAPGRDRLDAVVIRAMRRIGASAARCDSGAFFVLTPRAGRTAPNSGGDSAATRCPRGLAPRRGAASPLRAGPKTVMQASAAAAVSILRVLALFLAAGGLYGVVAFVVILRSHEIAVRMALGACARDVVTMIVAQALRPAATGAVAGVFVAVALGLVVRSRLHGAAAVDGVAFVYATSLLFAVLLAATIVPARRAARVNPVDRLRRE